jgi:integrase
MSRKGSWPPRVRHNKARGQDCIRLRENGRVREIYLGPSGSEQARKEYLRVVAELEAHGNQAPPAAGSAYLVAELLADYLSHAVDYYAGEQRQLARLKRMADTIDQLYGHVPAAEFGPRALRSCLERWVEEGLSRVYCNYLARAAKLCFKWGVEQELVNVQTWQSLLTVRGLRRGKTEAPEPEPVKPADPEEVAKTLPFLLPPVRAMVQLQGLTGMRPGEAVLLRPQDLDRTSLVVEGTPIWVYAPGSDEGPSGQHKNAWRGHARKIPLGPQAQAVLTPFLDRGADQYCFSPAEAMRAWLVAHGRKVHFRRKRAPGARYTTGSYDRSVSKACRKAGVERWRPNQLRHLLATLAHQGHGLDGARALLGHRELNMSLHYSEADLVQAAQIAAKIG